MFGLSFCSLGVTVTTILSVDVFGNILMWYLAKDVSIACIIIFGTELLCAIDKQLNIV